VLQQILISMGGVDKDNATSKVLEALKDVSLPHGCRVIVIMGAQAPWLEQVRAVAATLPCPNEVRVNIDDMAQVMANSDLAIGAAGSTSWERCCLGLPSMTVVLAANQQRIAKALHEQNAAINLGSVGDTGFSNKLTRTLHRMSSEQGLLESMIKATAAVTHGAGAEHTVRFMIGQ
jgi:spore coat polysaccharide biosynthesis predicted glycosyltransferase SpsG